MLVQKKSGVDAGVLYAMKVLKKAWVLNKVDVNTARKEILSALLLFLLYICVVVWCIVVKYHPLC